MFVAFGILTWTITITVCVISFPANQECKPCYKHSECKQDYTTSFHTKKFSLIWKINGNEAATCDTDGEKECLVYTNFKTRLRSNIYLQNELVTTEIAFTDYSSSSLNLSLYYNDETYLSLVFNCAIDFLELNTQSDSFDLTTKEHALREFNKNSPWDFNEWAIIAIIAIIAALLICVIIFYLNRRKYCMKIIRNKLEELNGFLTTKGHLNVGCFSGDGKLMPTNWKLGPTVALGVNTQVSYVDDFNKLFTEKCLVKQAFIPNDTDAKCLAAVDMDMKVLLTVKHVNILEFIGYSRNDKVFSVFMPLMALGSLATYINSQDSGHLTEEKTALFTSQILQGLDYLHKNNIIHWNLKASNILMKNKFQVKISDFGVTTILYILLQQIHGEETKNWMAPETFQNVPKDNKVDIWSLGCTVYQMITGNIPFSELTEQQIIERAVKKELQLSAPEHSSTNFKDFLLLTCIHDPTERPNVSELMQHNFTKVYKQTKPIRGKLRPDDQKTILYNYVFLLHELDGGVIIASMYQHHIFLKEHIDEVKNERKREDRTRRFLDKLLFSGPKDSFRVFIQALQDLYPHVAIRLLE